MAELAINAISEYFSNNHKALSEHFQIDLSEKHLIETVLLTFVNVLVWIVLPKLQYKYNIISRFVGHDLGRAADILAYLFIHIATYRNYCFTEAIMNNKQFSSEFSFVYSLVGIMFILFGGYLIIISFVKLGLRGMYFGDHFGFLLKNKITSFPYNVLENPQYIGNTLLYFGIAILFKSYTGIFLTALIYLSYQIVVVATEKNQLTKFYKQD